MSFKMKNFFRESFKIFATLISTLTILPLFVVVVILPLAIWRGFVVILAKGFRPDFQRACTLITNLYAVDKVHDKPRGTLLVIQHFNGPISLTTLQNRFKELISSGKRPELQCCVTPWLGTFFLQKCQNFQLDNHLKLKDVEAEKDFDEFVEDLVSGPWERNKPLWEFHVLPNYKNVSMGTESCLIFRFHHSLMDGLSAHCLGSDIFDPDPKLEEDVAAFIQGLKDKYTPSPTMKILGFFYLLLIAPFRTIYKMISATETNIWTIRNSEQIGETSTFTTNMTKEEMQVSWLKELSKKVGKSITCLLFEAFTAATRAHFLEKNGTVKRDIHSFYAIPGPGHPGHFQLTNYYFPEIITVPISISTSNRRKRMTLISKQFKRMMTTPEPFATYIFTLMASLICGVGNKFVPHFGGHCCSVIHSNVVNGAKRPIRFCGAESVFSVPQTGVHSPDNSIYFLSVSYNGRVALTVRADKKIFPDKQSCEKFLDKVLQELRDINKEVNVSQVVVSKM